jgi:hypothetical protein
MRIIEEDLIFDLQPPQMRLQHVQFFVYGHARPIRKSKGGMDNGRGTGWTRAGWNQSY